MPYVLSQALVSLVFSMKMPFPIMRPGKDPLTRHCEGSKKRRKTKEAVGRQRRRVDKTGLSRVTEGCGIQTEMGAAACETIGGVPTTVWVDMSHIDV